MLATLTNHDQFSPLMRNRLKTASMGLGFVRLLLAADRAEEARTTLLSLQYGFQVPDTIVHIGVCSGDPEFAVPAHPFSSQPGLPPHNRRRFANDSFRSRAAVAP